MCLRTGRRRYRSPERARRRKRPDHPARRCRSSRDIVARPAGRDEAARARCRSGRASRPCPERLERHRRAAPVSPRRRVSRRAPATECSSRSGRPRSHKLAGRGISRVRFAVLSSRLGELPDVVESGSGYIRLQALDARRICVQEVCEAPDDVAAALIFYLAHLLYDGAAVGFF